MLYENPEERWSTVASFGTLNKDETDYVVYSDIINIKQINDSNKIFVSTVIGFPYSIAFQYFF